MVAREAPAASGAGGPVRVLHVDDDPEYAELTAAHLERESDRLDVRTATAASEGLEVVERGPVDCVVSDYNMPGMDGLAFLEAVRERYPDLPFILFTGEGSEAVASDAIAAGATDYLQKGGTEQYALLANRIENVVAQHASERERRLWKRAVETAQEGIAVVGADGRYVLMNEAYAACYGRTPGELVGTHWRHQYPDGEAARFERDVLPQLEQGGTWTGESVGVRAGGDRFRQALSLSGLADGGHVRVLRDVTERVERERELERERDRFSALFESFPEPTVEYEYPPGADEPVVRAVNEAFEATFGVDAGDAEGRRIDDLVVPPERRAEARELDERVREGERVDAEVWRRAADGDRYFRFRNIAVPGEAGPDGFGVYTDLTEREEREAVLETLHAAAADIQACESIEAACERTVRAAENVLDLRLCTILVHEDGWLVPRASSSDAPPDGTRRMRTDQGLAGKTYRNGETYVVDDVEADPDTDPAKANYRSGMSVPVGDVGVFQAVADERGAFDATDVSLAELLVAHTARTLDRLQFEAQLRDRQAELRRQNERLDEFASVVSHDLRNPLNVAQGRAELIAAECDSDHVGPLADALDRMAAIVDDTLALARQGRTVADRQEVRVHETLEECWRGVETDGADLAVDGPFSVRADPDRLRHVFENLFRNAVEHSDGDVTVRVGRLDGGFYVEDDGPGIPAGEREAVFDPGHTTDADGTGFGLTIVREVVRAHGWEIRATEGRDGGARFEVTGVDSA